ncbi:hypothetical protein OUZ56_009094 [Daphnia magna]|uniref:Uncharacterized protein n=1 Tax=Daphnia magna TaxID=35525 RepID=A0ABR0AF14_9CRUS|nr:hypothetical protein OUZ56_009094 [Daphnia magna]
MSGHEAYLEVLNSQTPLTLSYGNLGNQRRRNSRTATSPSGINNVLADARTKLFSSWRDGSTQGFLFYTKPTQKRQPNNFWFIGPDAENFRDSTGWDDGNGGGLRSITKKLFCGWKARSPDALHVPKTKVVSNQEPTLDITGETVDVLDHISITNAASIAVERAESLAAKNLLSKQKQPGWSTMSATERVAAVSILRRKPVLLKWILPLGNIIPQTRVFHISKICPQHLEVLVSIPPPQSLPRQMPFHLN